MTGSTGQLGKSLKQISLDYEHKFFFTSKEELDITNFESIKIFLIENSIDTIINCAAYTDVQKAEKNRYITEKINHFAVENIAKICSQTDTQLIHISTDYVFDGCQKYPYTEMCDAAPLNHYGKTKLSGEKKILSYNPKKSAIIRTSWLYSKFQNNFLSKIMLKLENEKEIFIVDDEISSPTNSFDLAKIILEIIPKLVNLNTKVYHFSNLGFCSRYNFAKKINEYLKSDCVITPIKQNSIEIKRPRFSSLDCTSIIEDFGLKINSWEVSLDNCMQKKNNKIYE